MWIGIIVVFPRGRWVNGSDKVSFDDQVEWWRTGSICPGHFYRTKGSAYEKKVCKISKVDVVVEGFLSRLLMRNLVVIDFGSLWMAIHGLHQSINLQQITRMLSSIISIM
jgi:hypothetical protein